MDRTLGRVSSTAGIFPQLSSYHPSNVEAPHFRFTFHLATPFFLLLLILVYLQFEK